MPDSTEIRLDKLERLLGLGLGGDLASVQEDVVSLKQQIVGLRTERNVGNVLGGMLRTEIAPGLLPIGPYRQDVDATHSLEFTLWVSEEVLRIRKMTIHLTPKASRISAGVAASSGDLTSNSGGGSTSGSSSSSTTDANGSFINVESAGHTHIWLSFVNATPSHSSTSVSGNVTTPTGTPSATLQVPSSPHTHIENEVFGGNTSAENSSTGAATTTHTHAITIAANQNVQVYGNYSKWGTFDSAGSAAALSAFDLVAIASHNNDMYTAISTNTPTSVPTAAHSHGMAHTHTTPNHQHVTPGHTHSITLDISESGMADDLEILIDGVNRTTLLGGPWTADSDIVLTPTLLNTVGFVDARLEPVAGAHIIKITSSAEGAVEVVGDYSVIIKGVQ